MATSNGENGSNGNGDAQETLAAGQTSLGVSIHATPLRLSRISAVLEVYDPTLVLRASEVLSDFRIVLGTRTVYSGRAIIRNVLNAGLVLVCEVVLNEGSWIEWDVHQANNGYLRHKFDKFIAEWPQMYRISPEFKIVVADMHNFLSDMRLWLEQVELNVHSQPSGSSHEYERNILEGLREPAQSTLGMLFERFEHVAQSVPKELQPAHSLYVKRQLHASVLCAPFMYRTFHKPLGYAGDYAMVKMMSEDPYQGGSVFAKVLNAFFLNTPPVVAHRNRIERLTQCLAEETNRVNRKKRATRVFNMGVGPALEIQAFLRQAPPWAELEFTLLDFNDETVQHTSHVLQTLERQLGFRHRIDVVKKSVHQLMKEHSKPVPVFQRGSYDLVYCAGLFDYLSDPVCRKLMQIFYDLTAPGGLLLATNVASHNPSRGWMELAVDWHLFHRNADEVAKLAPEQAPADAVRVIAEPSGVNIFVEIRKPENG
ncbi:MAG TPA: class I SAM-dependent methyltransferase [Candidatus Angelobacter sp.]|nr:class I SAM-dependent methyltransferase [Candidatus Angelobacter sp.]